MYRPSRGTDLEAAHRSIGGRGAALVDKGGTRCRQPFAMGIVQSNPVELTMQVKVQPISSELMVPASRVMIPAVGKTIQQ